MFGEKVVGENSGKFKIVGIILLIILLIVVGYFLVSKGVFKGKNKTNNANTEQKQDDKNKLDEVIEAEVKNLENISGFLNAKGNSSGANVFKDVNMRFLYIDYLLMQKGTIKWTDDQTTPYVQAPKYKHDYVELFGNNNDYQLDTKSVDAENYNNCSAYGESMSRRFICWNVDFNTDTTLDMEIKNTSYVNELYTITGTYTKKNSGGSNIESGNFEIEYNIVDTHIYLNSISMKKS